MPRVDRGADRSGPVPGGRRHPRRSERSRLARSRRAEGGARHRGPARGAARAAARARDRRARCPSRRGGGRGLAEAHRPGRAGAHRRAARAGRRLSRDLRRARGAPCRHRPRLRQGDPGGGRRCCRDHRGRHRHRRGDRRARSPGLRRSGRHGAVHRPARPRRSVRRALCEAIGRMACGRRSWSTSGAWRSASAIRISSPCAPPWSGGQGVYHSRSRGLWIKGATSGATQELLRIDADCDRDCLRFTVRQQPPGFCHLGTRTCWGEDTGLGDLARRLAERKASRARGILHRGAVRRSGAARSQAARGSGRAGGSRRRAPTRSTRLRIYSISPSRRSPATTSTSPRSSARSPAAPSRSPAGTEASAPNARPGGTGRPWGRRRLRARHGLG